MWQTKLKEVWKNKWKIIKAVTNSWVGSTKIKLMSKERTSICESNKCGHYDKEGLSEHVILKGEPACGICGCNVKYLTSLPEATCSLQDLNEVPLWAAKKI